MGYGKEMKERRDPAGRFKRSFGLLIDRQVNIGQRIAKRITSGTSGTSRVIILEKKERQGQGGWRAVAVLICKM